MEINLEHYVNLARKYILLIVFCALLFTIPTAVYSSRTYVPFYEASTKLIVNKTVQQDPTGLGNEQIDLGAINSNIQLINTYKEIIKTPAIMDKVAQRYPDLNLTSEQLAAKINVSDVNNTQVMSIVAYDTSYERAAKITTYVSKVFETELPKIMMVDNVAILSGAKLDDNPPPINSKSNTYLILSFIGSLVVSVAIIILLETMDNTIKSEADIREMLGTSTLALIPKTKAKHLKRKRSATRKKAGEVPQYATIHE